MKLPNEVIHTTIQLLDSKMSLGEEATIAVVVIVGTTSVENVAAECCLVPRNFGQFREEQIFTALRREKSESDLSEAD